MTERFLGLRAAQARAAARRENERTPRQTATFSPEARSALAGAGWLVVPLDLDIYKHTLYDWHSRVDKDRFVLPSVVCGTEVAILRQGQARDIVAFQDGKNSYKEQYSSLDRFARETRQTLRIAEQVEAYVPSLAEFFSLMGKAPQEMQDLWKKMGYSPIRTRDAFPNDPSMGCVVTWQYSTIDFVPFNDFGVVCKLLPLIRPEEPITQTTTVLFTKSASKS